ncbi:MAG: glycosyltransferase [Saprospiraceae bacterium]|nr:glycosyltransferase [Saprospiraceae bacterium]MCF8250278.1 glycosyltransferase [Saprospiraceae bacterium]MCF8280894.1 glycosyltransferase [Bacteroidales bacterium]MCF8312090.1 glycosyltransferase [Saprospiraceae bacterium]MCF8440497.1 glycosyltransferase [Saprospiraceae bacterium]
MLETIILYGFVAATAVQLFFWLFVFGKLARHPVEEIPDHGSEVPDANNSPETGQHEFTAAKDCPLPTTKLPSPSVSVIICARNEAENLERHLDRILNQTYRSLEILLVLHKSSDNSFNILTSLQRKFNHLRIVICDDERIGKKFALAKGIEQAKHQVLLLTDADCVPASQDWIQGMVAGMDENTHIVLGVAPYDEAPGPLNKFVRYEACYTAMQYLSLALTGHPYMGVGRNLAYRRELYERTGGFRSHEHLASGDDDLFVNAAARRGKVGIRLNPRTFVYSKPKLTWRAYYRQKTRHFSTGSEYKFKDKFILSLLTMSHLLHYFLGGLLLIFKISIMFALLGYAVRMGVVLAIGSMILDKLQHRSLRLWLPALDCLLILYYLVFAPSVLMNNDDTQQWN